MTPARARPESLPDRLAASRTSADGEPDPPCWTLSEESYGLPVDPQHEPSRRAAGAALVGSERVAFEIVSGAPSRSEGELPVYRLEGGPALAVATGRLFVRLAPDQAAEDHAEAFSELGLVTEEIPAYAPHCAWLAPATGRVADGLKAAATLTARSAVESVEPQLLRVSQRRLGARRR
jgi:hypothetical protein